jgi:RNA polymerase sigma-70 factor, ECF subfamily
MSPGSSGDAALDDLAQRAAAGDRTALEDLLARIQPRVRRICGRMLLYPQDAEEATQDALLLVATKINTFAGRSRFTTWLHAVAANSARSTYRSLKRRAGERPTGNENYPAGADPRTTSVIAGTRLDLLEALEALAVDHPDYVESLVLRDIQQLSYEEIARQLVQPVGTIKSRVHRARQVVRPMLQIHDGGCLRDRRRRRRPQASPRATSPPTRVINFFEPSRPS